MSSRSSFHEGEAAVQRRVGTSDAAARIANGFDHALAPGHRSFLAAQRSVAVGVEDATGRPWASLWLGPPGFATSEHGGSVTVDDPVITETTDDPVVASLAPDRRIGMLAIDLSTRRRLRINGTVTERREGRVEVAVREVFPNCPKYIQRRQLGAEAPPGPVQPVRKGRALDADARELLARADTLFVASRHPERGVDVSHRGGEPGFVHVLDDQRLRMPDYPGNGMFQTLGNLQVDARAGIVVVDFARGALLSLTGEVEVAFDSRDPALPTGGTHRSLSVVVHEWVWFPLARLRSLVLLEPWPHNPPVRGAP